MMVTLEVTPRASQHSPAMNESLAVRQEALLRQNQELNQQVEAIEQRRQQHVASASRPSSSSSVSSLRGTRSASPQIESPRRKSNSLKDDQDQQSNPKPNLEIHLSASIDSLSSQDLKEPRRHLAKSESKERVATGSRNNSAKRSQRHKKQTGIESSPQDVPSNTKKFGVSSESPDNVAPLRGGEPEGLGLEATIRYQKARLRVLQDEADAAMAQTEQMVWMIRVLPYATFSVLLAYAFLLHGSSKQHKAP
ncbi:unnamed protein product [Phytophthora fragariaefolia]|uniref:Unnamed protein product n=1 Tax=Phytophthora fragariaefolia TaxID=1490495 RepID=A0A9W7DFF2_9STRA|nr:unnamed protein product [Phytophthora fragariaefolia]